MKKLFEEPEINKNIRDLGYNFIEKYGLLPNDALILATCKFYGVNYLFHLIVILEKFAKERE
ncbi:MAG: PIN domain-containing protein [Candidatus Odinarchaeia archaeon]